MKWGVRHDEPVGRNHSRRLHSDYSNRRISAQYNEKGLNDIRHTLQEKDAAIEKAHKKHDAIVKESKRTGKSAAEIEQQFGHKSFKLSDKQKKALLIGAGIAAGCLVAYGLYKYASYKGTISQGANLMSNSFDFSTVSSEMNSGNSDFLKSSFGDVGDFQAFSNTQENKKIINNLLTKSSGEWWKSLSNVEKEGISTYSSNAYSKMNDALWAAKGDDIFKYTDKVTANNIIAANSALNKASFPETMVCTQGLTMKNACSFLGCSQEELIAAAKSNGAGSNLIGAVNTNHGLFSTSTVAEGGFMGGVKYKVLTPKGAHAAYIEHISDFGDLWHPPMWDGVSTGGPPFSSEFETLFAAGSKFKTKGIQFNPNGYIEVALEYLLD